MRTLAFASVGGRLARGTSMTTTATIRSCAAHFGHRNGVRTRLHRCFATTPTTAAALRERRGDGVDVLHRILVGRHPAARHRAGRRRTHDRAATRAFFGREERKGPTEKTRTPIPFPRALSVGLSCAIDGAKGTVARPSDAWKPLTAATLVVAVALDGAGFYVAGRFLSPGEDAGMITALFSKIAVVAVDGAWIFIAPLLAIAVVQQVLPLLGEKIFFDALKATAGMGEEGEARVGKQSEEEEGIKVKKGGDAVRRKPSGRNGDKDGDGDVTTAAATWASEGDNAAAAAAAISPSSSSSSSRAGRVRQLESSAGLGLRGLGVAAARAQTLAGFGAAAVPIGLGLTVVPVVGPVAATALATVVAAYTLAWELLDPYFDKAGLAFEQQDKIMWNNRFALIAFACPFAAALAAGTSSDTLVPVVGPLSVTVAQGAAAELVWRVLEPDPEEAAP